jgi:hypothetical protein
MAIVRDTSAQPLCCRQPVVAAANRTATPTQVFSDAVRGQGFSLFCIARLPFEVTL